MRVTSVTYRTNKITRPYESEHCEITVDVGPKDDPNKAYRYAKFCVKMKLGLITKKEINDACTLSDEYREYVEFIKLGVK